MKILFDEVGNDWALIGEFSTKDAQGEVSKEIQEALLELVRTLNRALGKPQVSVLPY